MQQLLGDHVEAKANANAFLRELFLQRLPSNVRMVLATADATADLSRLADMADKIVEVATPTIAAIFSTDSSSEVKQLKDEVSHVANLVASLTYDHPHRPSYGRSKGSRPSSPAPQDNQQQPARPLCWYHHKFGDAANKCQPPCH